MTGQIYESFEHMANASGQLVANSPVGKGVCVWNANTDQCGDGHRVSPLSINNWYGDGVSTDSDVFSQVMVSIDSYEITTGKLAECDLTDKHVWENLKTDSPMEIGMEITLVDLNDNEDVRIASVNMQTGELSMDGSSLGSLQQTPIDAFISAIDGGIRIMPAAEKLVWQFVLDNPQKFITR